MAAPVFKTKDMKQEMRKIDGTAFSFYPTYIFQKRKEMYKDRIGLHEPRYHGRVKR